MERKGARKRRWTLDDLRVEIFNRTGNEREESIRYDDRDEGEERR